MYFIPLILLIAAAWCTIGILLAKWLKQAGYTKPFKGKDWESGELYGGGVGFGRVFGMTGEGSRGGRSSDWRDERERERRVLPEFGGGRVKGL